MKKVIRSTATKLVGLTIAVLAIPAGGLLSMATSWEGTPLILGLALTGWGLFALSMVVGIRSDDQQVRRPVDERMQDVLNEVKTSMAKAALLMDELQRELDAQTAIRDALVTQAAEQQRLAEIDQVQAEKIREILFAESRGETIRQKRTQLWYFVGGVVVSIPIGFAVNLLTR